MLKVNANFQRKECQLQTNPCVVEKIISLPPDEYDAFSHSLLRDQDFIRDNVEHMYVDDEEVSHCLLVIPETGGDGILVESQGYDYARYAAPLPQASVLAAQELKSSYPSLDAFCIRMADAADRIISEGISSSVNGGKYLNYAEVLDYIDIDIEFEESAADLLFKMLRGRKEVTNLFFDEKGIGMEFDPACCTSQINSEEEHPDPAPELKL